MNPMNSTGNETCVLLARYVLFPPSCPSSLIENYKAISLSFALAYGTMVIVHARNLAVKVVKHDFQVRWSNSSLVVDLLILLGALSCLVQFSNYLKYHHDDNCVAELAEDLRTSFITIAL